MISLAYKATMPYLVRYPFIPALPAWRSLMDSHPNLIAYLLGGKQNLFLASGISGVGNDELSQR